MKRISSSLPFVLITGLSICVLLLSWTIIKSKRDKAYLTHRLEEKKEYLDFYTRQVRYNFLPLKGFVSTRVYDSLSNDLYIRSVISAGTKLFFRFTENNCNSCVEAELPGIKEVADIIGKDNIVVLISYSGNNAVRFIKKNYNLPYQVYNVPIEALAKNKIEKLNVPYLFIGDSLGTSNFFIPEKTMPVFSKLYYREVIDAFSNKFQDEVMQVNVEISKIRFSVDTIDLKEIKYLSRATAEYAFINNGIAPLQLLKVVPDCNCIVSRWPQYKIMPGDSAAIKIQYNASSLGSFERKIKVFANIDAPIVLTVRGTVTQ